MIPANELAAMQASINQLLPDICSILTVTHTSDGAGGSTDTYGTTTGIACRLDFSSRGTYATEQLTAGAIQPFIRGMLTLPYNTSIASSNQVVHNGHTYNVIGDPQSDASWLGCIRVAVEAVR